MRSESIRLPQGINPRTGKKEYKDEQLAVLKPKWKKLWHELTSLPEEWINSAVEIYHLSPLTWPGLIVAEGANKKIGNYYRRLQDEHPEIPRQRLYREAVKAASEEVEGENRRKEEPQYWIFGWEYSLESRQRKRRRSFEWQWEHLTVPQIKARYAI